MQLVDQILIDTLRFGLGGFQPAENFLDAVDSGQDQRYRFSGDRHAIAEFAHQRLGSVRERFQPRQPKKAAGALDGVNEAKNIV